MQSALHTGSAPCKRLRSLSKFPNPAPNVWAVEQVLLAAVVQLDGRPALVESPFNAVSSLDRHRHASAKVLACSSI